MLSLLGNDVNNVKTCIYTFPKVLDDIEVLNSFSTHATGAHGPAEPHSTKARRFDL